MSVLVTGGTGFLGSTLIPKLLDKGEQVIALARDLEKAKATLPDVEVIKGDITEPGLGIEKVPQIDKLYHLAAVHNLGRDKDGSVWRTNVEGTKNVISFCAKYDVSHLYFCSTAYTEERNTYEKSKALCELIVKESNIPKVTIFKPSIVMGVPLHPFPGHFVQLVSILIKIHQRAEVIRRKVEGTLRLPVLQPTFRFLANAEGKLNIIPVEPVAEAMASIDKPGTYWLTHPNPPTIGQLVDWVGEFILVRLEISSQFKPTPLEAVFYRLAQPFLPYLMGDTFKSDLPSCPPITKEFIHNTIKATLFG